MKKIIDLSTFAEGGVSEKFNIEMQKVLENIQDPNTDATKARKITLTVTITPNGKRSLADVQVSTKSALVPMKEVASSIIMDYDASGKVTGAELKSGIPGQTFIDEEGDIASDKGEKLSEIEQQRERKALGFK